MSDTNQLKISILDVVKDNEYDINDLIKVLQPLGDYIENIIFVDHLKQLCQVILEDRDGNNKFTFDDLKLLKNDIVGITSIINGILLLCGLIPTIKLKYEQGATEELIFKILAYLFLVVIPKEINKPWCYEDKVQVLEVIFAIYQVLMTSQIIKDLLCKITEWFKKKGWCKCCNAESEQDRRLKVVDDHLPAICLNIKCNIQKNKDIIKLNNEINDLKKAINTN
jgi:hypothetical protein